MKCTLIRIDTARPFVAEATLVNNADGSVSFQLPNGLFAGQEPRQYGVRHPDSAENKQYQRATLNGSNAVFCTRPEDPPFVYLFAQGQVYPS